MWTQVLNREWTEVSATSPGEFQLELRDIYGNLSGQLSVLSQTKPSLERFGSQTLANGIFELQTLTDIQK